MFNIIKFFKGINIVPKTTSDIDSQGELEVLSTDGKIRYHNGTTASPIVTESHTATLTNKTLTSPILNTPTADTITGIAGGALTIQSASTQDLILQASDDIFFNAGGSNQYGSITDNGTWTIGASGSTASHVINGSTIRFQRTGGDVHLDIESLVSGEPALYFNQATRDWIFGVNSSGILKLNRGNLISSTAALQIDTSGNITFTGSTLNTNAFRSNGGIGVNADPTTTNIANFILNQAASTRLVLSNSNASGDARIIASSSADTLSLIADSDATILSGSSFGSLNINQSGAKAINFRTNSNLNMVISSAGAITLGATSSTVTHKFNGDAIQCIASTSTGNFDISRGASAASISISGDSGLGNGGEIQLFGGSHASAPAEVRIKQNGNVVIKVGASGVLNLGISASSATHQVNANALTLAHSSATGTFSLNRSSSTGTLTLSGGSSSSLGGRINLYAETHAAKAKKIELVSNDVVFTLPTADGITGQFIKTDGSGNLSFGSPVNSYTVISKTSNYTILNTDQVILADASGGTFTLTLPTAIGNAGVFFKLKKTDSTFNQISIATTGGQTIDGSSSSSLNTQNEEIEILSDGTNWQILNRRIPSGFISYAPTISGFGTVSSTAFFYRRIGDSIEIQGKFTAGTVAASTASITLPSGLTFDSSKLAAGYNNANLVGQGAISGNSEIITSLIDSTDTSVIKLGKAGSSFTGQNFFNGNQIMSDTQQLTLFCKGPITNWNS